MNGALCLYPIPSAIFLYNQRRTEMGAKLSGYPEHRYVITANWHKACNITGIAPIDNTNTVSKQIYS